MNRVSQSTAEIHALNEKFWNHQLINGDFYEQLKQFDFDVCNCVLVKVFPDSANTYCGVLVSQDGNVYEFDLDLEDSNYSSITNISDFFMAEYKNEKKN
ncbi:hypothetical protein [Pseudoalteromonas gelatinilytica]